MELFALPLQVRPLPSSYMINSITTKRYPLSLQTGFLSCKNKQFSLLPVVLPLFPSYFFSFCWLFNLFLFPCIFEFNLLIETLSIETPTETKLGKSFGKIVPFECLIFPYSSSFHIPWQASKDLQRFVFLL